MSREVICMEGKIKQIQRNETMQRRSDGDKRVGERSCPWVVVRLHFLLLGFIQFPHVLKINKSLLPQAGLSRFLHLAMSHPWLRHTITENTTLLKLSLYSLLNQTVNSLCAGIKSFSRVSNHLASKYSVNKEIWTNISPSVRYPTFEPMF